MTGTVDLAAALQQRPQAPADLLHRRPELRPVMPLAVVLVEAVTG